MVKEGRVSVEIEHLGKIGDEGFVIFRVDKVLVMLDVLPIWPGKSITQVLPHCDTHLWSIQKSWDLPL